MYIVCSAVRAQSQGKAKYKHKDKLNKIASIALAKFDFLGLDH